jgi:hypothetical protein
MMPAPRSAEATGKTQKRAKNRGSSFSYLCGENTREAKTAKIKYSSLLQIPNMIIIDVLWVYSVKS